jgi:branched-chain amino acid aminotransferase
MKLRQLSSVLAPRRLVAQQWASSSTMASRLYSTSKLTEMDASKLTITKTTTPKELTAPEDLVFGHTFTDHMLTCEWTATDGNYFWLEYTSKHN